jgi:hypothetical protein
MDVPLWIDFVLCAAERRAFEIFLGHLHTIEVDQPTDCIIFAINDLDVHTIAIIHYLTCTLIISTD